MDQGRLRGKTALITGAGRRIGFAIALALAKEGVNVVAHYPFEVDETEELRDELSAIGVRFWSLKADFGNQQEYGDLIKRAVESAGPLNFLINNASIFHADTIRDMNFESFTRHMQVNAWAPFMLCRQFAESAGEGKIINILDSRIEGYDWKHVSYILSKHVLMILTKMTALEFAPDITVNAIAPGLILPPPGKDHGYLDNLANTVPLKRHGGPGDIAEAVVYLLKADFLTGQIIYADGGRHLMEYVNGPHPD